MNNMHRKSLLLASTAITGMAVMGLMATPAHAACTADDDEVTCSGTDGVGESFTDPVQTILVETGAVVDTTTEALSLTTASNATNLSVTVNGSVIPGEGGTIVAEDDNTIGGNSIVVTGTGGTVDLAGNDITITISETGVVEGDIVATTDKGTVTVTNAGSMTATVAAVAVSSSEGNASFTNSGGLVDNQVSVDAEDGNATFTNNGTADVGEGGVQVLAGNTEDSEDTNGNATLVNTSSETLESDATVTIDGDATATYTNSGATVVEEGSLNITAGTAATYTNSGTTDVEGGSINITAGTTATVTNSGTTTVSESINVSATEGITVDNTGTISYQNEESFNLSTEDGDVDVETTEDGDITTTTQNGGAITLTNGPDATIENAGGDVDTVNITVTGSGAVTLLNDVGATIDDSIDIFAQAMTTVDDESTGMGTGEITTTYTSDGVTVTNSEGATITGDVNIETVGPVVVTNNGLMGDDLDIDAQQANSFNNGQAFTEEGGTQTSTTWVGGDVTVTNTSADTLEGDIDIDTVGDVNVTNTGRIVGDSEEGEADIIDINAEERDSTNSDVEVMETETVDDTTTDVTTRTTTETNTRVGGDVTVSNTSSGTIGTLQFIGSNEDSIEIDAFGDVDVTNDGVVFGEIDIDTDGFDGEGDTTSEMVTTTTVVTVDVPDPDPDEVTTTVVTKNTFTQTHNGGDVTVVNTGSINESAAFEGTAGEIDIDASVGNISITNTGFIDGGVETNEDNASEDVIDGRLEMDTDYKNIMDMFTETVVDGLTTTVVDTETGTAVGGNVTVINDGVINANTAGDDGDGTEPGVYADNFGDVSVVNNGTVQQGILAEAGGDDMEFTNTWTRTIVEDDPDFATLVFSSSRTPSDEGGDVTVTNDGFVGENSESSIGVHAKSFAGDATVTNGTSPLPAWDPKLPEPDVPTIEGDVFVEAARTAETLEETFRDPEIGEGFSFSTAGTELLERSTTDTWGGGNALLTNNGNIFGNVEVDGFDTATAANNAFATITGGVDVNSAFFDTTTEFVRDWSGTLTTTSNTETGTWVGGDASLTNETDAVILGDVDVTGFNSATLTNRGLIDPESGNVTVDSLFFNSSTTRTDNDENNEDPIRRVIVNTDTETMVGGTTVVDNSGWIDDELDASGATVTVTNTGEITEGININEEAFNFVAGTTTVTDTVTSETTEFVPASEQLALTSTVNQNGWVAGGIEVNGIGSTNTINLNDGSMTVADPEFGSFAIEAEFDEDGDGDSDRSLDPHNLLTLTSNQTDTTVNLNGSGWLGGRSQDEDEFDVSFTHVESFHSEERDHTFTGNGNVIGVTALNKTGSGTFYVVADLIDADTTTISEGTLQVSRFSSENPFFEDFSGTVFNGDIVNNATLVPGWLVDVDPINDVDSDEDGTDDPADPLRSLGDEKVKGNTLWVEGDFTQGSGGTTVIGMNPEVSRDIDDLDSTLVREPLGLPIFALEREAFIPGCVDDTICNSGAGFISVLGDANVAGTVTVIVNEGLYLDGQSQDFLAVGGTGTVSATAVSNRSSLFVNFGVQMTSAGTYGVVVTRNSYGSGGTTPNQVAVGTGLDSALPVVVSRIEDDSFSSIREFNAVQDMANILSGFDWDLSESGQVAAALSELDGQFYSSIAAVNFNKDFISNMRTQLNGRRAHGAPGVNGSGLGVWVDGYGQFSDLGDSDGPVSEISANTRGGQVGVDMRFSDNFIFGLAAGHADSNVSAVTRPESADVDLTQVGAYASWSAGEGSSIDGLYVDLSLMYAWGDVNTTRVQDIYGRTSVAAFDIQEFRFGGEVGFDFDINNDNFFITPLVGIQYRDVEHDEFVEEQIGGATTFSATERGGISLVVDEREDSNADFYIGADARYEYTDPDGVFKSLTPRASFRYTFADMDNASTQAFYAGGSSFTIQGVEVDNYFSFDAGVLAQVSERIGLFVNYKLTTGSDIDSHGIAAGVRIGLN